MEGGSGAAEAERWLTIAAKLLAARDLHGARTFAIRARESDPRYEGSSQVLAVSDTLLAGDSMVNNHPDWYSVLQLARFTGDADLIASQHRKLAQLLNPVRTRLAFADQAVKLVHEAWSVLSNPAKKALYDNELNLGQLGQTQNQPLTPNQQRQNQNPNPNSLRPTPPPPNLQAPPLTPTPIQQIQSPNASATPVRRSSRARDGRVVLYGEEEDDEEDPIFTESARPVRERRAAEPRSRPNRAASRPIQAEPAPVAEPEPEPEEVPGFWTACPYCYHLFEYQKGYEECALRCQNCRRAFHAAVIESPPLAADGKNPHFCSWGFYPLGFSGNLKSVSSNWSPILGMFACPLQPDGKPTITPEAKTQSQSRRGRPRRNPHAPAPARQQNYNYDSDVLIDLSDMSNDSDDDDDWDDWGGRGSNKKAKANNGKGKGPVGRPRKVAAAATQGEVVVVHALSADPKKHLVASGGKKQSVKAAKDLGKLDLNVEFSNDVEEQGRSEGNGAGTGARNREEDNIESIGFFEGLDEFLSSLPILNVVGDDKVKAG